MEDVWSAVCVLGSAGVLGGLIGIERELKNRWAGLRTHMMVSLGAAMFVHVGVNGSEGDTGALTRVMQGIAAGVGFIGAGTILQLKDKVDVKGLTTASTIWLAAAVGAGCGGELYAAASIAVLFTLLIMAGLGGLEKSLKPSPSVTASPGTDDVQADSGKSER